MVCFPLKLAKVTCLIQDVVSPHCGDKRMARCCMWFSLPNYFVMTHDVISLECETQHSNVTLAKLMWRHAQNIVSLRVLYKFNSTNVICLKFVFIEMLDKLNTYTVCWYKTFYQVMSVVWTNRITTHHFCDL